MAWLGQGRNWDTRETLKGSWPLDRGHEEGRVRKKWRWGEYLRTGRAGGGNDNQQGQPDALGDRWEDRREDLLYCNAVSRGLT